jgi:hypothetical protein
VFDPAPIGSSCADDDACNGDETCDASAVCQDGAPKLVDDGDSCTTDTCDGATGLVSHQRTAGCLSWTPLATTGAPSPRQRPAHVWTGSKLLVWGGGVDGQPFVIGDGAAYDPASDSWSPLSTVNAPSPREGHVAVWTGSKMVVWGGADLSAMSPQGAVYDPAADTWTPMSTAGQPTPRVLHSMVWTGKKVVVWGGLAGPTPLSSGGLYDPETNTWAALPQAGAPSQRFGQSGVWAYDRLIVWGGQNTFDWLDDGRSWLGALGAAGQWVGFTSTTNAPSIREGHSALWTGHRMLVWGGWNGGALLGRRRFVRSRFRRQRHVVHDERRGRALGAAGCCRRLDRLGDVPLGGALRRKRGVSTTATAASTDRTSGPERGRRSPSLPCSLRAISTPWSGPARRSWCGAVSRRRRSATEPA